MSTTTQGDVGFDVQTIIAITALELLREKGWKITEQLTTSINALTRSQAPCSRKLSVSA